MSNPFLLPTEHYSRDLQFVEGGLRDYALYLSLQTGDPLDECEAFVKQYVAQDGPKPLVSPKCLILDKNEFGDRELKQVSFMQFIRRVQKHDLLMSPSMAVYMPETRRKSTHAQYIEEGVKNRKKVKGEMFDAERAMADPKLTPVEKGAFKDIMVFKKGAQNNLKINNNSYSGATVSEATILHYKSTHSSLTSTCRVATSYANACNEKFIAGNRHYYDPEVTKANLLFIMNNADLPLIDRVCQQFNLKYPTVDDVVEMVFYSANNYWQAPGQEIRLRSMLINTTPTQRAAVMYVGDMYQLYNHNKEAITQFLLQLGMVGDVGVEVDAATYKGYDDDLQMLAAFLCYESVQGRDINKLKEEDPAVFAQVKATAQRASTTLLQYQDLLKAFFMSNVMPSSIHAFPTIYRKAVPISDTDSTMFTLQYWVEQIYGEVVFTPEAKRLVFGLVFLVSQSVTHLLALLSTNMGVQEAKMRLLAMKNEYYFEILNLTTRSKHYYASQDAQEGIMFPSFKMETKGVGLRNSKLPRKLNQAAKRMMRKDVVETVKAGRKINITKMLTQIADMERDIIKSLRNGSMEFLSTGQIKTLASYKKEDNATYKQYSLWQEVFAPTFGSIKAPPYSFVQVSTVAHNKTEQNAWYERMNNPQLAQRFKDWMAREGKTEMGTLMIPSEVVESTGVPPEITCAIDDRRIISNVMGTFYLMLESVGVFLIDKNNTRLVSDYY